MTTVKGTWTSGPMKIPITLNIKVTIQITREPLFLRLPNLPSIPPSRLSTMPLSVMTLNAPEENRIMAMIFAVAWNPFVMDVKVPIKPTGLCSTR